MMSGHSTLEGFFYFVSQFMEIKEYIHNEVIYHEGDIAEYVYLVLLGKVSFKAIKYHSATYSFEEYCSFLQSIKADAFLTQSTIQINQSIYPIRDVSDIKAIPNLIIKREILTYAAVSDLQSIQSLYAKKGIDDTYLQLNSVLSNSMSMDAYYDGILQSFTESELFYRKLITPSQRKITVITYTPSNSIEKLQCFGCYPLGENGVKLQETASAISPTIVVQINKRLYANCVINEQRVSIEKDITFLHQSYFFKGMRRGIFTKHFYYEFNYEELPFNHILYRENEQLDKLYIIKEGSVELSINNKSLIELRSIISKLKALDNSQFTQEEYDDTVLLLNPISSLIPMLNHKKSFVLFKTSRTVLSEWEFFYKTPTVYTARVASEHARVYSIPLEKLNERSNEDLGPLMRSLKEEALSKLRGVLKRIIAIKKSQYEKVDSDYANSIKEEEKMSSLESAMKSFENNKNTLRAPNTKVVDLSSNQSILRKSIGISNVKKHSHTRNITMLEGNLYSLKCNTEKRKEEKEKSKRIVDKGQSIKATSVQMNTKERIVYIEKKRKIMRKEQNKNTSATIAYTLPNLTSLSPLSLKAASDKKALSPSIALPQTINKSQGRIHLELPIESLPSTKKTLNYLTVKKYKGYSNEVLMESIKLKFSSKGKQH